MNNGDNRHLPELAPYGLTWYFTYVMKDGTAHRIDNLNRDTAEAYFNIRREEFAYCQYGNVADGAYTNASADMLAIVDLSKG